MTDALNVPTGATVVVSPPRVPQIAAPPPTAPAGVVLPIPGPPGAPGSPGAGIVVRQLTPVTVIDLTHNLGRDGPIGAVFYSPDYATQWDGVTTQPMSPNVLRVSFDDPTAFIALLT